MTIFYSGWGKLFSRELIEKNELRMDNRYRITEDTDFVMRYLESVNKVYLVDACYYHYMQVNEWSLTMIKDPERLRDAAFNIEKRLASLMRAWGMDEERTERDRIEYLSTQLKAASFAKLRSGAKYAEKKSFVKDALKVEGFRDWLRKGNMSSKVLSMGFIPSLLYVKAHRPYHVLFG